MLKTLARGTRQRPSAPAKCAGGCRRRARPAAPATARPFARQSGEADVLCRARGSTSRARRRKPGTSNSICSDMRARLRRRRLLRPVSDQRSGAGRCVIEALGAPPDFPIGGRTLREVLIDGVSLVARARHAVPAFSYITGGERRQKAKALAAGEDPDGDAATLDVLAAIEKFPGIRPDPEAFIEALDPLQPRLYSISSSLKANPAAFRSRSIPCATRSTNARAARRRLDITSPSASQPGRQAQGLCAEGARLSACRPIPPCRSS